MDSTLRIAGDRDSVTIVDVASGLNQILLRADAQILLDKLTEFENKEGSTDFSLSNFRALGVQGTPSGVQFAFFYREQGPQRWTTLNKQQTRTAIDELKALLKP